MELASGHEILASQSCIPCEGGTAPLSTAKVAELLPRLCGWSAKEGMIERTFFFDNYLKTMEFVNAVARIAEAEGHHPDMHVCYGECRVCLMTHAIGGLSENDFIVAAKVDMLEVCELPRT